LASLLLEVSNPSFSLFFNHVLDLLPPYDPPQYVFQISLLEAQTLVPYFFPMRMRAVSGGLEIDSGDTEMDARVGIEGL